MGQGRRGSHDLPSAATHAVVTPRCRPSRAARSTEPWEGETAQSLSSCPRVPVPLARAGRPQHQLTLPVAPRAWEGRCRFEPWVGVTPARGPWTVSPAHLAGGAESREGRPRGRRLEREEDDRGAEESRRGGAARPRSELVSESCDPTPVRFPGEMPENQPVQRSRSLKCDSPLPQAQDLTAFRASRCPRTP